MVYTKARLEHALKVFRETAVYRNKRGLPSEHLERHLRSGYGLRAVSKVIPLTNVNVWQERDKQDGSDDEEYDPKKERKRLNAKRKKAEHKRKAEDSVDQEKVLKRQKGDELISGGDGAYVTLRLTSKKGRKLLADLSRVHRTHLASFVDKNDSEQEPSYWRKNGTVRHPRGTLEQDWMWENDLITGTDVDIDECPAGNASHSLTTSLRNGKVLKKESEIERLDNSTIKTSELHIDVTRIPNSIAVPLDHIQQGEPSHPEAKANITKPIGDGTVANPIELDDDSDEQIDHFESNCNFRRDNVRDTINDYNAKVEHESPAVPSMTSFSFESAKDALFFHNEANIFPIETAYAHPIDFKHVALPDHPCDFCSDFRMSVLGYGKRTIEVFVDPDNPTQLQELGGGHRKNGRPSTKMCISCALDRLLIMRCHCKEDDDSTMRNGASNRHEDGVASYAFSRIAGPANYQYHLKHVYLVELFAKPGPGDTRNSRVIKQGPLVTCNLCLAPASWQCAKWQKADKVKRPCKIPYEHSDGRPISPMSAAISLSSTPSYSPARQISETRNTTRDNSHIGNQGDDDYNLTLSTISFEDSAERHTHSSERSNSHSVTQRTISSPVAHTSPTTPPSQRSTLRQALRGCGLRLCDACKNFVETSCKGILDKKLIMKRLRNEKENKFDMRADIEWLFKGSMLERQYER